MQIEGQILNKYEICVEGNLNQKGLKGFEVLYVRFFFVLNIQKEVENENFFIRINFLKEFFFGGFLVEEKVFFLVLFIFVIYGWKIMVIYVNENFVLWNEYLEELKKEVFLK